MNIEIFKFIDEKTNGIVAKFDNTENSNLTVHLLLNDEVIETALTQGCSHLFHIEKSGYFHVEVNQTQNMNTQALFKSESMQFNLNHDTNKKNEACNLAPKIKTNNIKIDEINQYSLDIKIEKGHAHKITKELLLNLTPSMLNLASLATDPRYNQYEYLTYNEETNFEILHKLATQIEQLDYVAYCCVTPNTSNYAPPKLPVNQENSETLSHQTSRDTSTPDFNYRQTYLDAPYGMNVRDAWEKGITGSQAVVRHLDYGIYRNHEDLIDSNITVVNSRSENEDCNHGTASTGCIAATKNGFGVTGIAHDCQFYFYDTGDLDLIVNDAQAGDIVSLDIQVSINGRLLPITAIRSWWERIQIIVNKGATVILAAGNGSLDLSKPGVMEDYGDSGSMLVGACFSNSGKRVNFSNYNQKTSLINSWGDWSVATTGYGSLQKLPGNERNYSRDYSGTSSATPLCSGALALIQDYAKKHHAILSSWTMRKLISKSNYTEGLQGGIGYRPNVDYLLAEVDMLIQRTELIEEM